MKQGGWREKQPRMQKPDPNPNAQPNPLCVFSAPVDGRKNPTCPLASSSNNERNSFAGRRKKRVFERYCLLWLGGARHLFYPYAMGIFLQRSAFNESETNCPGSTGAFFEEKTAVLFPVFCCSYSSHSVVPYIRAHCWPCKGKNHLFYKKK